jgi:hypothetical protein
LAFDVKSSCFMGFSLHDFARIGLFPHFSKFTTTQIASRSSKSSFHIQPATSAFLQVDFGQIVRSKSLIYMKNYVLKKQIKNALAFDVKSSCMGGFSLHHFARIGLFPHFSKFTTTQLASRSLQMLQMCPTVKQVKS